MSNELAHSKNQFIGLSLQGDELGFAVLTGESSKLSLSHSIADVRRTLGSSRLTETTVERAIAQVEDIVIPLIRSLPASSEVKVSGEELVRLVNLLPNAPGDIASIVSVESLFNELADYAAGSPVAWRQGRSPEQVALALLVLREVMHHGGFRAVSLAYDMK